MTQNAKGKWTFTIKRNTQRADKARNQPLTQKSAALLGDSKGNITTFYGKQLPDGYVVVRDYSGNLSVAFNSKVSTAVADVLLWVGYDPVLQPTLFQVLSLRDAYETQSTSGIPSHHTTHEFPYYDTVNVHGEQFLPALVRVDSGYTLIIYPWFCPFSTGGWVYIPYQTLDMTSYLPSTGAQAFAICARDAGTISVVAGGTKTTPELIGASDFPTMPDATKHGMWAVRMYSGQDAIHQDLTANNDLYDLISMGVGGAGGGGYTPPATTAANDVQVGDGASPTGHWIKNTIAQFITTLRTTLDSVYQAKGTYVTSVTGTAPIVSGGGTTPAISISAATTVAAGSMSASDKLTVNTIEERILYELGY